MITLFTHFNTSDIFLQNLMSRSLPSRLHWRNFWLMGFLSMLLLPQLHSCPTEMHLFKAIFLLLWCLLLPLSGVPAARPVFDKCHTKALCPSPHCQVPSCWTALSLHRWQWGNLYPDYQDIWSASWTSSRGDHVEPSPACNSLLRCSTSSDTRMRVGQIIWFHFCFL